MARAAVAAGADGLLIEVHSNPACALSDGFQSLTPDNFARLMAELAPLAQLMAGGWPFSDNGIVNTPGL